MLRTDTGDVTVAEAAGMTQFLMRVPVPWVFVLTYLLGAGLEFVFPSPRIGPVSTIVGAALFVAGAMIAGWGWAIFRKARTTTVPGKSSASLITRGPYRVTRNPMYVGLTLAYLGEAGMLKQIWPVLLLPLTIAYLNWTVIPVEEARLKQDFQDEYERYRSRVRRWL